MVEKRKSIDFYNRLWRRKSGSSNSNINDGNRVDVAAQLLPNGHRLLDLGCGDGRLAQVLGSTFQEYYGLDIAASAVKAATRVGVKAQVWDLDSPPYPFPQGHFQAIAALDVIEHVWDPCQIMREISRLLCPGGVAVVAVPNIRYWPRLVQIVLKSNVPPTSDDTGAYDGGHIHYFAAGNLKSLLKSAGLRPEAICGVFGVKWFIGLRSPGLVIRAHKL